MSQVNVGQIITTPEQRDAIHVAIVPVIATVKLKPGQSIGLSDAEKLTVSPETPGIGIVDPFLTVSVRPNERFWMFLHPGSITSLRHDWTHPAFTKEKTAEEIRAKEWIEAFAEEIDKTYVELMSAADLYVECGDYTNSRSNEAYSSVGSGRWRIFWHHTPSGR